MNKNKKNILQFICPTGFYGAERWVLALAKHLDKDKYNCDLAITLEENSKELELVKKYKSCCGNTHELPMTNRFDLSIINKLVALIKQKDIAVIHTHGYKSDILGVLAAKKAGIPCVVTPHGFENASDLKLRLFIWLGCKAMTFATTVAPLSPQLVEDSKRMGVKENKIQYIQNGVDLSEVEEQRTKTAQPKTKKRIGFIGQMISRKNIKDILDIFNNINEKRDDIELILLGDGDERESLENYSKSLDSHSNIKFLGFRNDRLELLQSFDLFVMTSTLEGIPRCLMEACAMGVPVAAYNISGIDQLITHNQSGLLATLGDKEALQQYWEQLLNDKELAEKLTKNSKDYVYKHYSAQRMANEYDVLFQKLTQK